MAWKYLAASGSTGASGDRNIATKITITGTDPGATDPGTVVIEQGGTGGTTMASFRILFGHTEQICLPNIAHDFVTLTDAGCVIEYFKQHGYSA